MKKLLTFIALVFCAVIAFLYLNEKPVIRSAKDPKHIIDIAKKPIIDSKKVKLIPKSIKKDPPQSYPIEDADVYFIPPEHRYSGNIGGPPPLSLPAPR